MRGVDFRLVLTTVILFALVLATVAGFLAARVLMHAAETTSPHDRKFHDR